MSLVGRVLAWPIRGYRRFLSPLKPATCRFAPTCSQYAIEALSRHGAWHGSWLALWRILRCQPFAREGFDPVPVALPRRFWHAGPLKPPVRERGMSDQGPATNAAPGPTTEPVPETPKPKR